MAGSFDLVDGFFDGRLREVLTDYILDGLTLEQMADDLGDRGIVVSRQTVSRWVARLRTERQAAKAAS